LGILGVGIWIISYKSHFNSLLTSDNYIIVPGLMIAAGLLVVFVCIVGCVAVIKENRFILVSVSIIILSLKNNKPLLLFVILRIAPAIQAGLFHTLPTGLNLFLEMAYIDKFINFTMFYENNIVMTQIIFRWSSIPGRIGIWEC
jgi:hypothetical protein